MLSQECLIRTRMVIGLCWHGMTNGKGGQLTAHLILANPAGELIDGILFTETGFSTDCLFVYLVHTRHALRTQVSYALGHATTLSWRVETANMSLITTELLSRDVILSKCPRGKARGSQLSPAHYSHPECETPKYDESLVPWPLSEIPSRAGVVPILSVITSNA